MAKQYYIYILSNKNNNVLYTGITNDLVCRVNEHKNRLTPGSTKKYNVEKLVYFEVFEDQESAIVREKQIKAGSRMKKIELIQSLNPEWKDLYGSIV